MRWFIAFVNRLEEIGNDAANRGDLRGSIAEFDAETFAAALDVPVEQVKAVYASLQHAGWIADGVIADFQDRNPDQEDPTSAERQRKKRSRTTIQTRLDELTMNGRLSRERRIEFQARMQGLDHEGLIRLQVDLEEAAKPVTRDSRSSQRDIVTITPEKKDYKNGSKLEVITSGSASGEVVGSAKEEEVSGKTDDDVSHWLSAEAPDFVAQHWGISVDASRTRLRGWSAQVGDKVLFEVLQDAKGLEGAAFHLEVADQIRRRAGGYSTPGPTLYSRTTP